MSELALHSRTPRRLFLHAVVAGGALLGLAGCMTPSVDAPPASVIFFTALSASLDPEAQAAIVHIADDAKANPRVPVIVQGFADRIGSVAANQTLSELRAQVVADALVGQGVDRGRIVLRPRGATKSDPGVESRRVDVSFGR